VVVGSSKTQFCSMAGAGGGSATRRGTVRRFTVTISGHTRNTIEVRRGDGILESSLDRTLDWTGKFANVQVRVVNAGTTYFASLATIPDPALGQMSATERYDWYYRKDPDHDPDADCEGSLSVSLPAKLLTSASGPRHARFYAWAQLTLEGGTSLDAAERAQWDEKCDGEAPPPLTTSEKFDGPDGTYLRPSVGLLAVHFRREDGDGKRKPVGAFLGGKTFTLRTEVFSTEKPSCSAPCTGMSRTEESYSVTFTKR
jgi:hypothetical protein